MACDAQTIVTDAVCIECNIPPGMYLPILISLMCQLRDQQAALVANGGTAGVGSPEGVVTGSPGRTYFDTAADSLWVKKTGTGNTGWLQLIA